MRVRESGMPDAALWETFFDPTHIFDELGLGPDVSALIEFGCGYGTFTLPACRRISGRVTALELDEEMLARTRTRAKVAGIDNLDLKHVDFCELGSDVSNRSFDYAMLFNILHGEQPEMLLSSAHNLLAPQGAAGVIHWRYDEQTPRGPPMAIRPQAQDLTAIAAKLGFKVGPVLDLPPYHYGFRLEKA